MKGTIEANATNVACIVKVLDCSTCHITQKDSELLDDDVIDNEAHSARAIECPVIAYKYREGYFVYVSEDDVEDFEEGCRKAGYSEGFVKAVRMARQNKCKYLQLDCDGTTYSTLESYDW